MDGAGFAAILVSFLLNFLSALCEAAMILGSCVSAVIAWALLLATAWHLITGLLKGVAHVLREYC